MWINKFLFIIILIMKSWAVQSQSTHQIQLANQYYINGKWEKAYDIYQTLAQNKQNIPQIHTNYFNSLLKFEKFKTAEKYLKKVLKYYPNNIYYQIDKGLLVLKQRDKNKADKIFKNLILLSVENQYMIRTAAQYFLNKQLPKYALMAYLQSKKASNDENLFALELANIYRLLGDKTKMIEEYIRFGTTNSNNLQYVKNILQNILKEQSDIENFQQVLISKIQKFPNQMIYAELLIWVNLQRNNFYGAFIQAKAMDKKNKSKGKRSLAIGDIALQNKAYQDAITIYEYIITTYPQSNNFILARTKLIKAREEKIKNILPVDLAEIKILTSQYQSLIQEIGINQLTIDAYRNKALLHAFYLDEMDKAISILNEVITTPRISPKVIAQSKLDLGDIYLLSDDPWEATLLYSQVEKSNKETEIGHLAKLKNARLQYFKGNFQLAKSHLDILKLATTRVIANDAMSLSLLIQNNTAFDSSDLVMQKFATIDLMLYQNKKDSALLLFSKMLKQYPRHSLTDEIYWKKANIYIQLSRFEEAIKSLEAIQSGYDQDILGDDAMYLIAFVFDKHLKDKPKAMTTYRNLLTKYPGSVFVAESRKRFRLLRGG